MARKALRPWFAIPIALVVLCSDAKAQIQLGNYTSYSVSGKSVTVWAGGSGVRFTAYTSSIIRMDLLPSVMGIPDTSFVVIRDGSGAVPFVVQDSTNVLKLSTAEVSILCAKVPLRFTFQTGYGTTLLAQSPTTGFRWTPDPPLRTASFDLTPDDHFYGTGERGMSLDMRGQGFSTYNATLYGYSWPPSEMNVSVPFFGSPKGYALYFETMYPGTMDFGHYNGSAVSYHTQGGELSVYFIASPTIATELEAYTWLTGRQPLPPRWAFGFLQSKYGYRTETEVRQTIATMRSEGIPCDAIILDLFWYKKMGDLAWNATAFPQPSVMMRDLLQQGIKTITITQPYVVDGAMTSPEGQALGYFARTSAGDPYLLSNWWSCNCNATLLDITNPVAAAWWWQKHTSFMGPESSGVAGLWTDLGEPERHPSDMVHAIGSAAKVHNVYNLLWARTLFDGFSTLRPNRRIFNLTRSGYAGIQRYGVITWSGDVGRSFDGLAAQIPIMLNMGMSGLAYQNSDIGGFCCGATTGELYTRWMQFGVFCPITRAHGAGSTVGGQDTEPWVYGPVVESICRDYLRLRYRLLPYIYSAAYENYLTGMPIARPLLLESPNSYMDYPNEYRAYLFGNAILVSPVVAAGQASATVPLPQGQWVDAWRETVHHGGTTVTVPTPLEQMPLFVRAGSIIPMQSPMNYTNERPLDTLTLAVYAVAGTGGNFTLYEDDGQTLGYQTGAYATTTFVESSVSTGPGSTLDLVTNPTIGTYAGKPAHRVYLTEIHGVSAGPSSVQCNATSVPEALSYDAMRQSGHGYFYDAATRLLYIHTPTSPDSMYALVVQDAGLTGVGEEAVRPAEFALEQNFPNPFNPTTTIGFTVGGVRNQGPGVSEVRLVVYDILGREVAVLVNEKKAPGYYEVKFDATGLSSGVYFYRLESGSFSRTRKLMLIH